MVDDDCGATLHEELVKMAASLQAVKIRKIRTEGHTDDRGARAYNEALSKARSQAVADVFIAEGFKPENVSVAGHAWDFPIADNASREGRAANRRVTIIVPGQALFESN